MTEASDVQQMTLASIENERKPFLIAAPQGRTILALPVPGNVAHGPGGWQQIDITAPHAAEVLSPKRVTANVQVQTADSLVHYVNRFRNHDSVLFGDINTNTIIGVIDYHTESGIDEAGIKPNLATHRATLKLPFSQEWTIWSRASDKLMSHKDFATFLEENSIDIVNPIGADLLEHCRDLQVLGNVNFSSSVKMGDVTEFAYEKKTDATDKGGISLPSEIMLSIPVYFGESRVSIKAFMRRKIDDGALFLGLSLSRAENVRQDEFHRIMDAVTEHTEQLTTIYGTPA